MNDAVAVKFLNYLVPEGLSENSRGTVLLIACCSCNGLAGRLNVHAELF